MPSQLVLAMYHDRAALEERFRLDDPVGMIGRRLFAWTDQAPDAQEAEGIWTRILNLPVDDADRASLQFLFLTTGGAAVDPDGQRLRGFVGLCQRVPLLLFQVLPSLVHHWKWSSNDEPREDPYLERIVAPGHPRILPKLAFRGLAEALVPECLRHARDTEGFHPSATIRYARSINHLVNGQLEAALQVAGEEPFLYPVARKSMQNLHPVAWFMQATLSGIALDPRELRKRVTGQYPDDAILRTDIWHLLRTPLAKASELKQTLDRVADEGGRILTTGLDPIACNPIRAALLLGELDLAADFLSRRAANLRVSTGVDELFWMRIHLLEGDLDSAALFWARARSRARLFHALPRLDFELRLSREMDLVRFGELIDGPDEDQPVARTTATTARWSRRRPERRRPTTIIGRSRLMTDLRRTIATYAAEDIPVLVVGETGTGKDLVARSLHVGSTRCEGPFIAVNCASLNDNLLEAELFGHRQGSYTGASIERPGLVASAADGTLFLDEIGDTSPYFQTALLRLLENREYRPVGSDRTQTVACRIVAATNVDLEAAVVQGSFRKDLLYRLQRLQIEVPPLRSHLEDLGELVDHFLAESDRDAMRLAPDLLVALEELDWPGNVRQLRNLIEQLMVHWSGKSILDAADLQRLQRQRQQTRSWRRAERAEAAGSGTTAPSRTGQGPLGQGTPRMARLARLRELFAVHGRLTRQQVMAQTGVSQTTATADLRLLIEEGAIDKIAPTPAPRTHYFQVREPS